MNVSRPVMGQLAAILVSHWLMTTDSTLKLGIAVCGTGVGTLVLPPIVEYFISQLGWRGAMRCLSGLCLGSVLCGVSMFPAR